ncbi:MAG: exodeoxyribonuclease VII large subunit [Prevotella sp.]|nr:exodeoxyribonuclease VII large subunit [Prevotella sp.]
MKHERRLTLFELNSLVREVIECEMPHEYWVEAELSECRESRGHCFLELIQKDEHNATPIAKASAKCWASKWMIIRPYFERTTGQRLHAGMKVLLKVYPQFHEAFGFSWIVTDIDPTYTLGDMARKRQEIIRQLKEEGVFDLQKELQLPRFCQHIAVISSETAAGYGDFCNQLADNPYGFQFHTQLFPAIMQGEGVEQSIIAALNRIYQGQSNHNSQFPIINSQFDCVVIIRGGGATSDMSGFDTLALAENVANFPIPIITGIGHDRDESILDMVSHTRVKTPTAAAALLIEHLKAVLDVLNDAQDRITNIVQQKLSTLNTQLSTLQAAIPRILTVVLTRQHASLDALNQRLSSSIQRRIVSERGRMEAFEQRLPMLAERRLTQEKHQIEIISEKLRMLDPTLLLKRGYSITMKDGRVVKDVAALKTGDEIETKLSVGTIQSIIT